MKERSKRHHEVPEWLLTHFCLDNGETLWMGFKARLEVKPVSVNKAFRRTDANTRTDHKSRGDGTFERVESDRDEELLADLNDLALLRKSGILEGDLYRILARGVDCRSGLSCPRVRFSRRPIWSSKPMALPIRTI